MGERPRHHLTPANADAIHAPHSFFTASKPVAVICHAPWTLVEAGVLKGRTLTSYPTVKTDVENAGGKWVDQEVCVDGNLVTSRNPKDIPAFNAKILEVFARTTPAKAA